MLNKKKSNIIKDQKLFFDLQAKKKKNSKSNYSAKFASKEIILGMQWLGKCDNILDYGCGEGTTIDFFLNYAQKKVKITGIDLSDNAIINAKKKYPNYLFYKIANNNLDIIQNNFFDGSYLIMVLHHATDHQKIFNEIYKKTKIGGKFFICDLSSNNPIIKLGRYLFRFVPKYVKKNFEEDDLVVDGSIPDKYPVNIEQTKKKLLKAGFKIDEVGHGHLFFFLLDWLNRFIPIFNFKFFRYLFDQICKLEKKLILTKVGKRYSEVFFIKCTK